METLLVTGGAGFIGANLVAMALGRNGGRRRADRVVVLDALTYAGHLESLAEVERDPGFVFVRGSITDRPLLGRLFDRYRPGAVLHLAAESHVDRSIDGPFPFLETNTRGTLELLEAARLHHQGLPAGERGRFRFLHVSTDEVYGALDENEPRRFSETSPYAPSSPYAASKAAADHFVKAYHRTWGLPVLVTNCSNNYGPYQFPEKLIPLMVLNALEGRELPIYGDGRHVRDWIHVEDHCAGILRVLEAGRPGETYNIGAGEERANLQVVDAICAALESLRPAKTNARLAARGCSAYSDLKRRVEDRRGHDRRYAIDAGRIRSELGWTPRRDFESGLRETVRWYLDHAAWCEAVEGDGMRRQRLGLS